MPHAQAANCSILPAFQFLSKYALSAEIIKCVKRLTPEYDDMICCGNDQFFELSPVCRICKRFTSYKNHCNKFEVCLREVVGVLNRMLKKDCSSLPVVFTA